MGLQHYILSAAVTTWCLLLSKERPPHAPPPTHNRQMCMLLLTQGNEAAQGLATLEDVTSVVEELVLHGGVALGVVLAIHVPAACGVLQVL